MPRMKKTPMRPRSSDGSEDSGGKLQANRITYGKKSTATTDKTPKDVSVMPPPPRCALPLEKRKRKTLHSNSSALTSPSKSAKQKDNTARKEKAASVHSSGSSSSGTSSGADDGAPGQRTSDIEGDSEENLQTSTTPSRRRRPAKKTNEEYTESDCRKQLASLRSKDKRPPQSMTAETFASIFFLPTEGINSHTLKIGKDISLQEVEAVFGKEKAKNGFSLAEKLTPNLRKEAEKLYCLCYQKPHPPTHVAKEFAIGLVLDKVGHEKVNWAEFAAETNVRQWKSYCRRLRIWIQRLATLLNLPVSDVYEEEGFTEYNFNPAEKLTVGDFHSHIHLHEASQKDMQPRPFVRHDRSPDRELLTARKADVTDLVRILESQLERLQLQLDDKKAKAAQAGLQWEACFHLVEQFKSSLTKAGEECNVFAGEEEIERATKQAGIGTILKMYYSNVKKLSAFASTKSSLEAELHQSSAALKANSSRLAALQAYLVELAAGKDVGVMRPLPLCNTGEVLVGHYAQPVLPPALECSICSDGFPFWDIILCPCHHIYHPWCASQWFKTKVTCAVPDCGLVPPLWYRSWGFGNYDRVLRQTGDDLHQSATAAASPPQPILSPSKTAPGYSTVGEGAPSMSASDSTFSKCLGEERHYTLPKVLKLGMDGSDMSPLAALTEIDGACTPFGSQLSTPSTNFKQNCTVTSSLENSPPPVDLPMTTALADIPPISISEPSSPAAIAGLSNARFVKEDATQAATDFFEVEAGDPLLECRPETAVGKNSIQFGEDSDVVLPPMVNATESLKLPSTTTAVSPSLQKSSPPTVEDVTGTVEDPYSLTFLRSSKRLKKAVDNSENATSPTRQHKAGKDKCGNPLPTVTTLPKSVSKGNSVSPTGKGAKADAGTEEVSPGETPARVLRGRPTSGTTGGENASSSPIALGSKKNKGSLDSPQKDVSRGLERVPILVYEGDDSNTVPILGNSYTYVRSPGIHASVTVEVVPAMRLGSVPYSHQNGDSCSELAISNCSCQLEVEDRHYVGNGLLHPRYLIQFHKRRSGCTLRFVYCKEQDKCRETRNRLCDGHVPLEYIRECNSKCPCASDCPNRVVQRGVTAKLEVFHVNKYKGWGIRTLEYLQAGSFVFEYVGEVVTNAELLRRGDRSKYSIALDGDWESEAKKDDDSLLCIDATVMTNVARCGDANLMEMPVWVDSTSPTLYHVAFFANSVILAGEELTWDYGLYFDEDPSAFDCKCGSDMCRG